MNSDFASYAAHAIVPLEEAQRSGVPVLIPGAFGETRQRPGRSTQATR